MALQQKAAITNFALHWPLEVAINQFYNLIMLNLEDSTYTSFIIEHKHRVYKVLKG